MIVCEEMQRLRNKLDEENIEWKDKSNDFVCRTHFYYGINKISVINGEGTYGGLDNGKNIGLLEMMINYHDPIGYLNADEVIKKLKGMDENE